MNGSPLFTGGASSGESEMLEKDWIEAIVALPTDLFYNTAISTYVWLLNNRKLKARRGKVQLIDASSERFWKSMRKSLGSKRREILEAARHEIAHFYAEMLDGGAGHDEFSKIFDTTAFGYREIRIGIERPLRLSFQATPERLARLAEEKPIQKLDAVERQELLDALARRLPKQSFTNRRLEPAKAT
jgi:type I restriction enzyme M protein